MNDTLVTVVGNVATRPEYRQTATGASVVRFRLAVTARRWDRVRDGWVDGPTSFYTVWAWRSLAENVAASVSIGEPLVVHGKLRVRDERRDRGPAGGQRPGSGGRRDGPEAAAAEGGTTGASAGGGGGAAEDRDGTAGARGGSGEGVRWVSAEIDAVAVGHDLARGTAAFRRVSHLKPQLTGATAS
ncbi:single-stranded DNA-binding protein [Streptomyces sp. NPDC018031]|uniref:single-stranded DNA-binding protein n=1 Tax=Streptomyces sp. NPDC018031 TaxID=3365033 RepID=UPI0037A6BF72